MGALADVRQMVGLAHEVGALAWADGVHYAPHGPIDVATWGVDVLTCSPYKFFGPHFGVAFVRQATAGNPRYSEVRADDHPSTDMEPYPALTRYGPGAEVPDLRRQTRYAIGRFVASIDQRSREIAY